MVKRLLFLKYSGSDKPTELLSNTGVKQKECFGWRSKVMQFFVSGGTYFRRTEITAHFEYLEALVSLGVKS